MKPIRLTAVLVAVLALAAFAGVGRPDFAGGASAPTGGITVTGTGKIQVVPDLAQFTLAVQTHGATAHDALAANSERMRRVLAALFSAGIAKSDVQTQDVSVSQSYSGAGLADGYDAHDSVSVTIRNLSKAGSVLDAASSAGANDIYGPTLMRSDEDQLQAKALRSAVQNARDKAQALADAAGVRLGSVTAISEVGEPAPMPNFAAALRAPEKAPVEPGKQDVQATVTVTFAIR